MRCQFGVLFVLALTLVMSSVHVSFLWEPFPQAIAPSKTNIRSRCAMYSRFSSECRELGLPSESAIGQPSVIDSPVKVSVIVPDLLIKSIGLGSSKRVSVGALFVRSGARFRE